MKESKNISPTRSLAALIWFLTLIAAQTLAQHSPPPGVKLEVVSVRVLSDREAAERSPDFVGPNVAVRLRLSCSSTGFFLYSYSNAIAPVGYSVKLVNGKTVWLFGKQGENQHSSSPGIDKATFGTRGVWLLLSGHQRPAVEWEELDSTSFVGETHAFTVFIKEQENDQPKEIVSQSYVVPAARPARE